MHLATLFDPSVDELEARLVVITTKETFTGITKSSIDFVALPDNLLVMAVLGDVPGTYDEFPERFREIAVLHGICPDKVKVEVDPNKDYWE